MAKFRSGELVKLKYGIDPISVGILAWANIDPDKNDFILIRPDVIGLYLKKTKAKKPKNVGKGYYTLHWFLFEDKICFISPKCLVALDAE